MLKPTPYSLKEYIKAISICSIGRFAKFEDYPSSGSAHGFRLFQKESDKEPCEIWIVHTGHGKKRKIYPRDFKKAPHHLGMTEESFVEVIKNI